MQVLKDEIKRAIVKAAIDEFYEKGYEKASLRTIAKKAGITVGNLYSYFVSKLKLFTFIVEPVFSDLMEVFMVHESYASLETEEVLKLFDTVISQVLGELQRHRKELLILIDGSKGTPFADAKEKFISFMANHLEKEHLKESAKLGKPALDGHLVRPFAVSFVEGYIEILRTVKNHKHSVEVGTDFIRVFFIEGLGKYL